MTQPSPRATLGAMATADGGAPEGRAGFVGDPPTSYETAYASPLRNSRVAVLPHEYRLLKSTPVGWPAAQGRPVTPAGERVSPRFVVVPPNGQHLAVDWGRLFDVRRGDGSYALGNEKAHAYDLTATDDAFYIYGNEVLWAGGPGSAAKPPIGVTPEGSMLAFRLDRSRRILAEQVSPADPHGGGDWAVQVLAERFARPDRSYAEPAFQGIYPGRGVAVVTADWRTIVAMDDGVLRVLSPQGDATLSAVEEVRLSLGYVARWISVVAPYVFVASDDPSGTRLHCLDHRGAERWSAAVPFKVNQPPVDAARGRVVLAGGGLAAIQDGQVVWSSSSASPVYATAFEDGTLAVALAGSLRIVDREGAVRQELRADDGDQMTTPPAIGRDGTIWLASQKALYVAK